MATDTLEIFGTEYSGVTGIKATDDNNQTKTYIRPQGTVTISSNGTTDVTNYASASVAKGLLNNLSITGNTPSISVDNNGLITATVATKSDTIECVSSSSGGYIAGGSTTNYYVWGTSATQQITAGTEGTPTATKGAVNNHAISVTPSVTNTTGYITGGTKTGTAVSVLASELVSGTVSITSSGNTDVTNYATASVASGSATASATKGTVSNHAITVTPSVTRTAGYITAGSANGTAVTVTASELASGNKAITANGTNIDVVGYSTVSVDVSGGGGSSVAEEQVDTELESNSYTLTFTDLQGEPTSFIVMYDDGMSVPSSTPYRAISIVYDGTDVHAQTLTNTNNAQVSYDGSNFSQSYSNGTLTITSTGAEFISGWWVMSYTYGGTAGNINTADVQVGSGATSITFTGLEDEPLCWSCIFKSNFSTSSGYQRVIAVRKREQGNGDVNIYGFAMDSSAHGSSTLWSESYNNGTLTITSQGTNAGGYFHQPGYYQLTYAVADASPYEKVSKTYRASTSAQTDKIEPTSPYEAMDEVNITIPAVTQTNLTAANIKSGTTVTISNGSSNLWSVTGTYGGGGSSMNVQTNQSTTRTTNTSLTSLNSLTCSTT